jgi:hypothetical protein
MGDRDARQARLRNGSFASWSEPWKFHKFDNFKSNRQQKMRREGREEGYQRKDTEGERYVRKQERGGVS